MPVRAAIGGLDAIGTMAKRPVGGDNGHVTTLDNGAEAPNDVDAVGDSDLVLRTRSGDRAAYAELWRRHYRSGMAVARSITSAIDADDLVQESYAQIYQSILKGGGPTASFRAYLFTSIRNTAAGWGRARRETAIEVPETLEDPASSVQATEDALNRSITVQAFRSLPSRWQEVLWYSEIEQLKPAEIAPLLGMKAAAVAQLAFRAREGLREAWVQAHLRGVAEGSDCQRTISHLGAYARGNLGKRETARVETHLHECARCAIVAAEARDVSHRLALVLLPVTIGVTGTAAYLATLQGGGTSIVAMAAMPSTTITGAVSGGAAASGGAGAAGVGAAGVGAASAGAVGSGAGVAASGAGVVGSGLAAASTAAATAAATAGAGAAVTAAGGLLSGLGATMSLVAASTVIVGSVIVGAFALPLTDSPSATTIESAADDQPGAASQSEQKNVSSVSPSGLAVPVVPVAPVAPVDAGATDAASADPPASANDAAATDGATGGATGTPPNGAGSANVPANGGGASNAGVANGAANGSTNAAVNGGTANGSTNGAVNGGTANGNANGAVNGGTSNGNANGVTNGVTNGNTNGNANGAANGNGGSGGSAAPVTPALPAGSPVIAGATGSTAAGGAVLTVMVTGAAGATVDVLVNGAVAATATLDGEGSGSAAVPLTNGSLVSNAPLRARYVAGNEKGPFGTTVRLSAFVDLDDMREAAREDKSGNGQANGKSDE